jgi:hypothetical protein
MNNLYFYDTLYYSNYEPYSKPVLDYIAHNNLREKMNCIPVDRRWVDPQTGQFIIQLDNGQTMPLPPCVQSVPTLLAKRTLHAYVGDRAIIAYFNPPPLPADGARPDFSQRGEPAPANLLSQAITGTQFGQSKMDFVPAGQPSQLTYLAPEPSRPEKLTPEFLDQAQGDRNRDAKKFEEDTTQLLSKIVESRDSDLREVQSAYVFPSQL